MTHLGLQACHELRLGVAGIDGGNHCFCGSVVNLEAAARSTRPIAECQTSNCSGDRTERCGASGRLFAFNFTCRGTRSEGDPAAPPGNDRTAAVERYPDRVRASLVPGVSTRCGGGVDSFPFNKSIPNVLLIGDSIMFAHYGPIVKQIFDRCELAPDFCLNNTEVLPRGRFPNDGMIASVQTTGQAANSASGVACIGSYLQGKQWDVISINFGVHDTCTGPSISFLTVSRAFLSSTPPHTRRVTCSTPWPC